MTKFYYRTLWFCVFRQKKSESGRRGRAGFAGIGTLRCLRAPMASLNEVMSRGSRDGDLRYRPLLAALRCVRDETW